MYHIPVDERDWNNYKKAKKFLDSISDDLDEKQKRKNNRLTVLFKKQLRGFCSLKVGTEYLFRVVTKLSDDV